MSSHLDDLTTVVMAKRPEPGRVKSRLLVGGAFDAQAAVEIAWAMLRCIVERLAANPHLILAVSPDGCGAALAEQLGFPSLPTVDQGPGDLGRRLNRIWQRVAADGAVAFLGSDSPDVPDRALYEELPAALEKCDVAVGPTVDGGYWTLAARSYYPQLLHGIDWGGPSVYDQTCRRAAGAGLSLQSLCVWPDVDRLDDVLALRRRLAGRSATPVGSSPRGAALQRLALRLDEVCGAPPPPQRTPT